MYVLYLVSGIPDKEEELATQKQCYNHAMRSRKKVVTSGLDSITEQSSPKFRLFLKNREVQQIHSLLNHVTSLPSSQRSAWISEYGDLVNQAFDALVDDSNEVLDSLPFDDEVLELTHELVTSLRDALHLMEGILHDQQQLVS